jgi:hypothetical protein
MTDVGVRPATAQDADAIALIHVGARAHAAGALAFNARHDFAEIRRTDGSENEEGEPDVRLRHPGALG